MEIKIEKIDLGDKFCLPPGYNVNDGNNLLNNYPQTPECARNLYEKNPLKEYAINA